MHKEFRGKAIYNPSGKAQEYSYWAANFYVGCSNECSYCYLKKGRGAAILGGNTPELKKCFKGKKHALEVFEKELDQNINEIRKHGLFFSFTTDPLLKETFMLTADAVALCLDRDIPVKVLTKTTKYLPSFILLLDLRNRNKRNLLAIGFTLTGRDDLEPYASTNNDRIKKMAILKTLEIKTFASIEPIISFSASIMMIMEIAKICDLIKVGLESGKKYDTDDLIDFVNWLKALKGPKIYLKDSITKLINYDLSFGDKFVNRSYNMFNDVDGE